MILVKIIDEDGEDVYVNPEYVHAVTNVPIDNSQRCRIDYGSGYMECIYVKARASVVVSQLRRKS